MARPAALQLLRKGKLLVGSVFPRFVDTWNWLVCAFDSTIGDRDLNPQQGYIYVDRSNPDRPVIRLDATRLPKATGGGSVVVDDESIGMTDDEKVEFKNFHDSSVKESDTLAKALVSSGITAESVERDSDALKYRPLGKFVSGNDSNITFTANSDGTVSINVYYK